MRSRLAALVDRLFDAADDDPLLLAAGALVGILVLVALIGFGIGAGALLWLGRPWTLIALPVIALGIGIVSEGRGDSEK